MAHLMAGRYWRRSIRVGDSVRHEYYGCDQAAAELAALDALIMVDRRRERQELLEAEERARRLYEQERARGLAVRAMVAVELEAMGFRRSGRNPWRRAMRKIQLPRPGDPGRPPSPREVQALVRRVQAGKPGALADLADLAKVHPRIVAESTTSDLAKIARTFLAEKVSGSGRNKAGELAVEARLDLLEAELAGTARGLAAKLCAAAAVHAGAEYWAITAAMAKLLGRATPGDLRRQRAALSMYLSSLRTFARIRAIEGGA
jgi:hypothetical protein